MSVNTRNYFKLIKILWSDLMYTLKNKLNLLKNTSDWYSSCFWKFWLVYSHCSDLLCGYPPSLIFYSSLVKILSKAISENASHRSNLEVEHRLRTQEVKIMKIWFLLVKIILSSIDKILVELTKLAIFYSHKENFMSIWIQCAFMKFSGFQWPITVSQKRSCPS